MSTNPNVKYNYALMGGHLCTDINQGALSAVLPFLVMYDGFSYAEVSLVIFGRNDFRADNELIDDISRFISDREPKPHKEKRRLFGAGAENAAADQEGAAEWMSR